MGVWKITKETPRSITGAYITDEGITVWKIKGY